MIIEHAYYVKDAARLSGLTVTMVNYLCRSDVLTPSLNYKPGRGRARQYSFGDIVILRALAKLLSFGVSVARIKVALKTIKNRHPEITPNTLPARYLVTDGNQVFLRQNGATLETLDESGQMSFIFVIELQSLCNEVVAATMEA
ncbi:MerR family transcriptional regulator [Sneathiella marina]|uniref:MerR family transcriptional regulator n=1 Tax=Sneathiella marina TaxID=2950108 RepID=UPI003B84A356